MQMDKCQICQRAFEEADSLAKSTALERDDLAQVSVNYKFQYPIEEEDKGLVGVVKTTILYQSLALITYIGAH
jgi:hypothetical protein